MSKKWKIISILSGLTLVITFAIAGVVALIQARTSTSFKISYTAQQVNCIVKQKMTQYNGVGAIKKGGVSVLGELEFSSSSLKKVEESSFPDIELETSDDYGLDYVVFTIVVQNTDTTDGNGIDISFKMDLDENCNLEREVTASIGNGVITEIQGETNENETTYQLGQINAGEYLTINIKLSVDDIDIDINHVEGSFHFNLDNIEL